MALNGIPTADPETKRFERLADHAPVMIWMSGTDGRCTWFNQPWLTFTGRTLEQELGDGWAEGVHPADLDRCLRIYREAFEARKPFTMDYRLRRADGTYRWIMDNGVPVNDDTGVFDGYMGSCVDVTDRREREERLHIVTKVGKLGAWDWDIVADTIAWTDAVYEIHGVRKDDFTPTLQGYGQLIHPDDRPRVRAAIDAALQKDVPYEIEFRTLTSEGRMEWVFTHAVVLREDGRPVRMLGSTMNITERKAMEMELARTSERLAKQVQGLERMHDLTVKLAGSLPTNNALYAILRTCTDAQGGISGLISQYDEATERLLVRAGVGIPHHVASAFAHLETGPRGGACGLAFQTKARVTIADMEDDPRVDENCRGIARAADFRSVHSTPIMDHTGRAVGVMSVHFTEPGRVPQELDMRLADLCARHAAEVLESDRQKRALRSSEERFTRFMRHLPGHAWIKDGQRRYVFINEGAAAIFGRTAEEVIGRTDHEVFPADDADHFAESDADVFATGKAIESIDFLHHSGTMHHSLVSKFLIPDVEGGPPLLAGIAIDITDRQRAENQRREAQERFELLADNMDQLAWMAAANGGTVWFNKRWEEFSGIPIAELRDRAATDLHHPDHYERVIASLQASAAQGANWEDVFPLKGRDGEWHWFLSRAMPVRDANGTIISWFGTSTDITAQRHAEQVLRESEERFHLLADNMAQLVWMSEADGNLTWYNRRFYEYTGLTPEVIKGDKGWSRLHPDHRERVAARRDAAHAAAEPWEETFPLLGADGCYRWFLMRAIPIRNDAGEVVRWFGTNTDITDQKNAEDKLKEADRRKDEFLATLAHELRNPLAPLRNGLALMKLAHDEPDVLRNTWGIMERQLDHMVRLIDDLMDVSRISRGTVELRKEPLDLRNVLQLAVNAVDGAMRQHGHHLRLDLPDRPVPVCGDTVRLTQVVSNLLHNAVKYTADGGDIRLVLHTSDGEATVQVRDNGVGIPTAMLPFVFDMFTQVDRSLDRSRGGLGIGLNIVQRLVAMHEGSVEAESSGSGNGSTFTVRLPLHQEVEQAPVAGHAALEEAGGRIRVLVVDDNADAADSMALLLRMLGHEPAVVYGGRAALEMGASFQPHLVLLDIGMPGMDGYAVCRHMREQDWGRHVTIAALTGWGQESDKQRSAEAGFDQHLVKPASPAQLNELLRAVADRRG